MAKTSLKYKIWTVLFLIIVVCASTVMLNIAYVNAKPEVEKKELLNLEQSVLDVFSIPYDQPDIETIFKENITIENINGMKIYRSYDGIAFQITGPGFWDKISVLLALEYDMETIMALKILSNNETPGLGARITEKWFLDQFRGKTVIPEIKVITQKTATSHTKADTTTGASYSHRKPNEVDAITGATQTSKALEKLINNGIRTFYQKTSLESNG